MEQVHAKPECEINRNTQITRDIWETLPVWRLLLQPDKTMCLVTHIFPMLLTLLLVFKHNLHHSRRNQIKEIISFLPYALELLEYPNPYGYSVLSHLFEIPSTQSPDKLQTTILFKKSQRQCMQILFMSEATEPIFWLIAVFHKPNPEGHFWCYSTWDSIFSDLRDQVF